MSNFMNAGLDPDSGTQELIYIDPEHGAPRVYYLSPNHDEANLTLVWATALLKAKGNINLTGFFSAEPGYERCRIAYDRSGCLYLVDEKNQKADFIYDYGIDDIRAVILSDGRTLAVLFEPEWADNHSVEFWQFTGTKLSRSYPIELDCSAEEDEDNDEPSGNLLPLYEIQFDDFLFAGPDNSLILYACGERSFTDLKSRPLQFLMRIDLNLPQGKASIRVQRLETPPKRWNPERCCIAVDIKRGLLAMPGMAIETTPGHDMGQPGYLQQVNLIDLNRIPPAGEAPLPVQELMLRIPVRSYSAEDLGSRFDPENQRDQAALIQRINSLQFSEQEDALWVCWHDHAIRKTALDGQWRSPVLAVADKADPERIRTSRSEASLLQAMPSPAKPRILLGGWHDLYTLRLSTEQLAALAMTSPSAALEGWSVVQEEVCDWGDDWSQPHKQSDEQKLHLALLGKRKTRVADFGSEQALGAALYYLSLKCSDMANFCTGNHLILAFTDGKEVWNEEQFFSTVIQLPFESAAELMADILNSFIAYEGADYCFSENEKPALADCALHLGLSDSRWLPLISRYLNAIDPDHEAFFTGEGVRLLESRHGNSPEWDSFYQSLPDTMAYHEEDFDDADEDEEDNDNDAPRRSDEEVRASIPAELLAQLAVKEQEARDAYQHQIDRVSEAETQAQISVLLDEWLNESHKAYIDPEIASINYTSRFRQRFKTEAHLALEAEIESYFTDLMDSFAVSEGDYYDLDINTFLDALFEKAEALQCWDALERYLKAQIQWLDENSEGNAWYFDQTTYGNYAAEALLRHDASYGPLYAQYLTSLRLAVPEETVGEFLREIIPELGISADTYPIILARLTYAEGQCGWEDVAHWCEVIPIRDWLYQNNKVGDFIAVVQADAERYCRSDADAKERVDAVKEMLNIEDPAQQALLREHSQAELLQSLYLQRDELYQQELSRIAAIDSPKAMAAALSRWQEELRHPDARVSLDPLCYDYEKRFELRFMGQEIRQLEQSMDKSLLEQLDLKKPRVYGEAISYCLFDKAKALGAWEVLEAYLKDQIRWYQDNQVSSAFYIEELPYGHYAAGMLAEAHSRYIPLYVEYLKALSVITEYKGTGEQIDDLFDHYCRYKEGIHGGFEVFLPVIQARLTHARGECWAESVRDWYEDYGLAEWLDSNRKAAEKLREQVQYELMQQGYDQDDINSTLALIGQSG
ncbi:hypothetical protein [Photobacterium sp. TLY01]|uniref:hypothetical protein n=1 Tax=Photobacterium sp. TLY01 TaxID=2907534 RepID=UPI001F216D7C|nr:hypothetical protein [Photobacterium sp. TLY01]UIP28766.1 hypothetical protein LN341_04600 [Photobacterium sp. TLY01]